MVICPDCGKDVTDAKFCSNCGATLKLPVGEVVDDAPVDDVVEEVNDVDFEEIVDDAPVDDVVEEVNDVDFEEAVDDEVGDDSVVDDAPVEDVVDVKVKEKTTNDEIEPNIVKKSKYCSNCGKELELETVFCPQCGTRFGADEETEKPQTKFCQTCGEKININAEICPHCGVRVANIRSSEEKSVLLSAILSFLFPGLGHLYLGLTKKGVSFIIAYIVSAILIFLLIGIVLVIIVWIWSLIDSIKSTEAINRGEFVEDKLF